MTCTLFLDLGTACGFAVGTPDEHGRINGLTGDWDLRRTKHESPAMSQIKLKRSLKALYDAAGFTHVGYETVARHLGTHAAHSYGANVFVVQEFCLEHGLPHEGVAVATLKKFWTGKGNAKKPEMILKCRERGYEPDTDNEADAIAGWHWLQAQFQSEVEFKEAAE